MTSPDFSAQNQLTELLRERKDALTIRWLWAIGVTGATAILLAVIGETHSHSVSGVLVAACWLAAFVLAVLSVVLPIGRLGDKRLRAFLRSRVDPERWAARMRLTSEQTRTFLALPVSEQRMLSLTILFERPYTQGLALASGIAGVAFVYGLLTRTMLDAAPFLLAALAMQGWHYPRLNRLVDRGRKIEATADDAEALAALAELRGAAKPKQEPTPDSDEPPPPAKPPPRQQPRFRKQR